MRALFSFLLLCLAAFGAFATEPLAIRLERTVDAAAETALRDGRFSGVILVAKDGKTLHRKAYGLADRERGIAHTPATRFMIMSVSKQFTAALIRGWRRREGFQFTTKSATTFRTGRCAGTTSRSITC